MYVINAGMEGEEEEEAWWLFVVVWIFHVPRGSGVVAG